MGVGLWGNALWSVGEQILNDWVLSGGFGVYVAPALEIYGNFIDFSWSATDIQYQAADGI